MQDNSTEFEDFEKESPNAESQENETEQEYKALIIPNFSLTSEEEKELLSELDSRIEESKNINKDHYLKIEKVRNHKDCKNDPEDRIKKLKSAEDTGSSSPNLHLPDLKNSGNIGASEIKDAIFTNNFLQWKASDPSYSEHEDTITKIFNSIREQTNTDYVEQKIIDNVWYEGTCPVIIKNDGRMNAHHEILYKSEVKLDDENIELISEYLITKIGIDPNSIPYIWKKVEPKLYFKNTLNYDDEMVTEIYLSNEYIVEVVEDDEDFIKTDAILSESFGIDLSKINTEAYDIKTTETWIEGFPKPEILNLLKTHIEPCESNNNPDTYTVAYEMPVKTINLYDNPNYMNKDKLMEQDGSFIGNNTVKKDGDTTKQTQTLKDKVCTFRSAYFENFKFSCGNKRVLRNFIVSGVLEGGKGDNKGILLECKPNMSFSEINKNKISKNPYIIFTYYETSTSNLGSCPALDMLDLTRINNILYNYGIETLATIGNKYALDASVNLKTVAGGAGALFVVDMLSSKMQQAGANDVRKLIQELPTDPTVVQLSLGQMPLLRDYIHQLSNTSASYFQSKTNQTATEVSTVANQASGIVKTVISQISKKLCDMYSRMWEDAVNRKMKVEIIATEKGENGEDVEVFKEIDLSDYKNKKFSPVITSITPNLSKQIISQKLIEILTMAIQSSHPEILSRLNIAEVVEYILDSYDIEQPNLTRNDEQAKQWRLENDEKEKIYEQLQSGDYQIVPTMPEASEGQGANGLPSDNINPTPIEQPIQ